MHVFGRNARKALRHPAAFALAVIKQFRANQGLLLAGAVAYYALLSLVPLLILVVLALTQIFDETQVLGTIGAAWNLSYPANQKRWSESCAPSWRIGKSSAGYCWP